MKESGSEGNQTLDEWFLMWFREQEFQEQKELLNTERALQNKKVMGLNSQSTV